VIITNYEDAAQFVEGTKRLVTDIETTGLGLENELIGIAVRDYDRKESAFIVVNHPDSEGLSMEDVKAFFDGYEGTTIWHNAAFDVKYFKYNGIVITGYHCTMLMAANLGFLVKEAGMDYLARKLLGVDTTTYASVVYENWEGPVTKKGEPRLKKDRTLTLQDVELSKVADYAIEDVDVTADLYTKFIASMKRNKYVRAAYQMDLRTCAALIEVELRGMYVDADELKDYIIEIGEEVTKEQLALSEELGDINLNSPAQLKTALNERIRPTIASTSKDVLAAHKDPICQRVSSYKGIVKLQGMADKLSIMCNPITGRLHGNYNLHITATSRMSSSNPNMQNINSEVRRAFTATDGNVLVVSDYSGQEVRVYAELMSCEVLTPLLHEGVDPHEVTTETLSHQFGIDVIRRVAKEIFFGIMYGQSAYGLAYRLGIEQEEAQEIIDAVLTMYPSLKEYTKQQAKMCYDKGYVQTLSGRPILIKGARSGDQATRSRAIRQACNAPMQGTGADMIKLAVIQLVKEGFALTGVVHDETITEVVKKTAEERQERIVKIMVDEGAVLCPSVPIVVDSKICNNWKEGK